MERINSVSCSSRCSETESSCAGASGTQPADSGELVSSISRDRFANLKTLSSMQGRMASVLNLLVCDDFLIISLVHPSLPCGWAGRLPQHHRVPHKPQSRKSKIYRTLDQANPCRGAQTALCDLGTRGTATIAGTLVAPIECILAQACSLVRGGF